MPSAVVPGGRVDIMDLRTEAAPKPTRGTAIDHIGFEVADLHAFLDLLEKRGYLGAYRLGLRRRARGGGREGRGKERIGKEKAEYDECSNLESFEVECEGFPACPVCSQFHNYKIKMAPEGGPERVAGASGALVTYE